jgi:very-short-patch-repair endonuclease
MRPKVPERPVDVRIAKLADAQHGTVDHEQLIDLGLHPRAIGRRLSAGRLHRLHRGVYAVGDRALPSLGRLAAAVRAIDAAASRRSAAALHGFRAYEGIPQVTARPGTKKRTGIDMVQAALQPDEVCVIRGIRTTTVARTLLDLAAIDEQLVKHALKQAEFLGVFDLAEVSRLLDRYPRRRGTARLRRVISQFADSDVRTRSEMEELFWTLVLDENLPRPAVNGTVALDEITIEADAVWRDAKLIVELDSRQAHATYDAFETDRERDRIAALDGWLVIRITWRQLDKQRKRLSRDIRRLLRERQRT